MENKKILTIVSAAVLAVIVAFTLTHKKTDYTKISNDNINEEINTAIQHKTSDKSKVEDTKQVNEKETKVAKKLNKIEKNKNGSHIKEVNIYKDDSGNTIPLSAISVISDLPSIIQDKVNKIAETNNIFMIQKHRDKLFIITDNSDNIRHGVEFKEINITNGHQTNTTLGYNDKIKDSDNDIWEYDNNSHLPTRHTKYNDNGDMVFVETWNYESDNPIKYEMKDAEGKVISLRKETLENGTNLRVEHLVYDKAGTTKINVSAVYEGSDIKRFTYYNADKINESGAVFGEYSEEGLKTKETLYSSDLKVKNTYISDYKDGSREDIIILDNQNKEVEKLVPKT